MNRFDDETLMRRIDGELDAATAAGVDSAAREDARIADRLEVLRGADRAVRAGFPTAVDPRDADLTRLIAAHGGRARVGRRWSWPRPRPWAVGIGTGLAVAGFVAGAVIAPVLTDRPVALVGGDGRIMETGLVQLLDRRLAADGVDDAGRAVGLTFQTADGQWCRTFTDSRRAMGGLACRGDDGWQVQALAPVAATGSDLRRAATDIPAPVLAAVDAMIATDTVDAAEEARARDAGFR